MIPAVNSELETKGELYNTYMYIWISDDKTYPETGSREPVSRNITDDAVGQTSTTESIGRTGSGLRLPGNPTPFDKSYDSPETRFFLEITSSGLFGLPSVRFLVCVRYSLWLTG